MRISKNKVERRMAELGLSQGDLARKMDVHFASVSHVLTSVKEGKELRPATVANLARGLGCAIDDLLAPLPSPRRSRAA